MKDWKEIDKNIKSEWAPPVFDFYIFGLSILIWKKFEFQLDVCETMPYQADGSVPLIFWQIGWVQFIFECKWIYKNIYIYKNKREPEGL